MIYVKDAFLSTIVIQDYIWKGNRPNVETFLQGFARLVAAAANLKVSRYRDVLKACNDSITREGFDQLPNYADSIRLAKLFLSIAEEQQPGDYGVPQTPWDLTDGDNAECTELGEATLG